MRITAEIRFFWPENAPEQLEQWFTSEEMHNGVKATPRQLRTDNYLYAPGLTELGIKTRKHTNGAEIKGLIVRDYGELPVEPFAGPVDLWTKWPGLPLDINEFRTIRVEKERLIRLFDTSLIEPIEDAAKVPPAGEDRACTFRDTAEGCIVELTRVRIENDCWWTMGFEAFGSMKRVFSSLKSVATLLATRQPPKLSGALIASYPEWLARQT